MNMEKERIELFKRRSFGDKLNATFDFVRENWRPLFKYITYLLLPVSLVAAFGMQGLSSFYFNAVLGSLSETAGEAFVESELFSMGIQFLLFIVAFGFMGILEGSIVYALMKLYSESPHGLEGITFADVKPLLKRNIGRMVLMVTVFLFVYMLAVGAMVGLAVLSPVTLVITIPALIVSILPLSLWTPAYLLEDLSLWSSLAKALRLGFATWGGILGITIVIGILVNIASTVVQLPFFIVAIVKGFLFTSDDGGPTVWIDFLSYLSSILMLYGSMLMSSLSLIALAYQYGHACDKVDGVSIDFDIEHFDEKE